jgi:hypothetical protein
MGVKLDSYIKGRTQIENKLLKRIFERKKKEVTERKTHVIKSLITCNPQRIQSGEVKVSLIDGTCSTNGRDEKCLLNFRRKS